MQVATQAFCPNL
jgi:hypothetical protein